LNSHLELRASILSLDPPGGAVGPHVAGRTDFGIELSLVPLSPMTGPLRRVAFIFVCPCPPAAEPAATVARALAAAAPAAAGTDTTKMKPTRRSGPGSSGESGPGSVNPEISATGDVRPTATTRGSSERISTRGVRVGFQSALDPYSNTKIFVSLENGSVGVEEGSRNWERVCRAHSQLRHRKFRQQFGELNRLAPARRARAEYPLGTCARTSEKMAWQEKRVISTLSRGFLGGAGGQTPKREVHGPSNPERGAMRSCSGGARDRPTWSICSTSGSSHPRHNADRRPPASMARTPVRRCAPSGRRRVPPDVATAAAGALYRNWTIRGELYALQKDSASATARRTWVGTSGSTYKLGRAGGSSAFDNDYVEDPISSQITRQVIPTLTLWESEWVELAGRMWSKLAAASATEPVRPSGGLGDRNLTNTRPMKCWHSLLH